MNKYISEGRSTLGAPQKNDADMSLDGPATGKKKNGKRAKKHPPRALTLALDPNFD